MAVPTFPFMEIALMKSLTMKGLRPQIKIVIASTVSSNEIPGNEGIETSWPVILRSTYTHSNETPGNEGIETSARKTGCCYPKL